MARWRNFPPPLSPSAPAGAWADGSRRLAALGLLCLSCTSGQIGGEVGYHGDATLELFGSCDVVDEVPIDADDPDLPFEVAPIVEALDGLRAVETMDWGSRLSEGLVLRPEPDTSELTIEIRYVEGSIRRLEREVADASGPLEGAGLGGAATDEAVDECPSLLAFDADVTISAQNGAIEDTFETMFVAVSPYLATAAFELEPRKFEGALEVDLDGVSGDDFGGGRFELAWADGQLSGRLTGVVTTGGGGDVAATSVELLRFPTGGCEDGHDLPADSALVTQTEDAISTLDTFDLVWPDSRATELGVTYEFGQSCLYPSGTSRAILVPVTCRAESVDGDVDGIWDLQAMVTLDDQGNATWAEVSRMDFSNWPAADFAAATGITGIAVEGSDFPITYTFTVSDELGDSIASQGTLSVLESRPILCDTPPDAPTDGGGVAPGCTGDELLEIGTATLTGSD